MSYFDFNDAPEQRTFELIPKGALVKVCLRIRPGGFDDPAQGWTGGYATRHPNTGSVYLNGEFTVMEGEYVRCKLWSLIGLYSPKGPEWGHIGRGLMKAMLCSARGIHPKDDSPAAQAALRIQGFADLEGLEFLAKVDWETDPHGQPKSVIKRAITPDHKDYARLMGPVGIAAPLAPPSPSQVTAPSAEPTTPPIRTGRPVWAE